MLFNIIGYNFPSQRIGESYGRLEAGDRAQALAAQNIARALIMKLFGLLSGG